MTKSKLLHFKVISKHTHQPIIEDNFMYNYSEKAGFSIQAVRDYLSYTLNVPDTHFHILIVGCWDV